ncbi:acetyl-CoA carboxylase biotin carboxyl carrier protein [Dioscorea alata]|uniref:Acetyl-CoA carboxylase biotin carboxyl carrier protein n=1 Tax=Dioscorea alata TaxID=55571 RepID=A0ACB7W628_DIOAL|nr:acetyl-CoA carboxylase biotin carboxyl carrier protein [Dioscorea alata]
MASSSSIPTASAAVRKLSSSLPPTAAAAPSRPAHRVSFRLSSVPAKLVFRSSQALKICSGRPTFVKAQMNEVAGSSSNDAAPAKSNVEIPEPKEKDPPSVPLSEEAVSEFMTQVASLVKLVDSKDIVELQLKQLGCELIIRKKEAVPQPLAAMPAVMMHPPPQTAAMPSQFPPPASPSTSLAPSPAAAVAPTSAPSSAPKPPKSSHPPLKSPMAGTFYRSPGPGLAPFVKVGDKVNKGQVICIIEAMKLMNEIEADQSGTVVEILADDGKPVGIEQPLFVIEP